MSDYIREAILIALSTTLILNQLGLFIVDFIQAIDRINFILISHLSIWAKLIFGLIMLRERITIEIK